MRKLTVDRPLPPALQRMISTRSSMRSRHSMRARRGHTGFQPFHDTSPVMSMKRITRCCDDWQAETAGRIRSNTVREFHMQRMDSVESYMQPTIEYIERLDLSEDPANFWTQQPIYQRVHSMAPVVPETWKTDAVAYISEQDEVKTPDKLVPKWRQILRCIGAYNRALVIVLSPALLALLFIWSTDVQMCCAFVVLLMACYWATEAIPLPVTAFLPVILFPLFGVLSGQRICPYYLQDTGFLFLGSLLVAVAVEESRIHERLAFGCLIATGARPRILLLGFQCAVAFLSMWLSNVATTALMMPATMAIIDVLKMSDKVNKVVKPEDKAAADANTPFSKCLLLCICFSSNIGGIATITGSSTNIVMSGQMQTLYPKENSLSYASWMACYIPLMVVVLLLSWIWLQFWFLGLRPKKSANPAEDETNRLNTMAILRKRYAELGPWRKHEVMITVIFCILVILWFLRDPKSFPGWGELFVVNFVTDGTTVMIICIAMFFIPRDFAIPSWMQRRNRVSDGGATSVSNEATLENGTLGRQNSVYDMMNKGDHKPMDQTPLLTWNLVRTQMDWGPVFLIGGGYALAAGVKFSGLSTTIGEQMKSIAALNPIVFCIITVVISGVFTEIASNTASASIFIPIMAALANEANVNPLAYILPVTMACSFPFMLPVAHPSNSIVYSCSAGLITVKDMAAAGFGLKIICNILVVVHAFTWAAFVYSFDVVPEWARDGLGPLGNATALALLNGTTLSPDYEF